MENNEIERLMSTAGRELPVVRFYTVDDVMKILGVGRKAVYTMLHEKQFPAFKINRVGYRIPQETFLAWLYQR